MSPTLIDIEQSVKPISRTLLPLLRPIAPTRPLPTLVLRDSSDSPFGATHTGWHVDTFVIPSAFPRSIPGSAVRPDQSPKPVSADGTPERIDVPRATSEMYQNQVDAFADPVDINNPGSWSEQEQLFLAVNRYRPSAAREGEQPGLTLVFSHANGFHKETWEPTIADLLDSLNAPGQSKALPIDEIWALDCVNQGDSAVLNEGALGNTFYWADHGRDILNFLIYYIDSPSLSSTSPSHIPSTLIPAAPVDSSLLDLDLSPDHLSSTSAIPSRRTYRKKLVVGIGHSLGSAGTAFAATALPSLFSSVVFCDPVLTPSVKSTSGLVGGAIGRREEWATREIAMEGFLKKPFFRAWDERVLGRYIELGLRDKVGGGVVLKTRGRDEALVFADPLCGCSRIAFARLASLPSSLPVHFILATPDRSVLSEPDIVKLLTQVPHATSTRVEDSGHLVVQEQPKGTALALAAFLRRVYPRGGVAKL